MKIGNCMICDQNVYILNCHYQCQNCGYTMDWEEGQDIGQVDQKERENVNAKVENISRKENTKKMEKNDFFSLCPSKKHPYSNKRKQILWVEL